MSGSLPEVRQGGDLPSQMGNCPGQAGRRRTARTEPSCPRIGRGDFMRFGSLSLSRTFALFSLVIIGLVTALQVLVQWTLLREDLLEWERRVSADTIRSEAYAVLRAEDFANWRSPESQERFERVFRRALWQLEILRIKVYDRDMRVIWSDEARLLGVRFSGNSHLTEALGGRTVAHLERAQRAENRYERQFTEPRASSRPSAETSSTRQRPSSPPTRSCGRRRSNSGQPSASPPSAR